MPGNEICLREGGREEIVTTTYAFRRSGLSSVTAIQTVRSAGGAPRGASVSALFYIAWARKDVGEHRILLRLILVNVAIWYVMLPFTYDWSFWKRDGAVFPLMGGLLFGFPLSLAVMALVTLIPYYSTWYRAGSGFGPDNVFAIFLHLIFVLTAYIQWFYLVPAAWRWARKRRQVRLSKSDNGGQWQS